MKKIKTILFVCTGNSCRSIMAEGILRKYLCDRGRTGIRVMSAGVGTIDGLPPAKNTVDVMNEYGMDVSSYRSRSLTNEMIARADLILVMEEGHRDEIIRRVPDARSKTFLLRQYGRECDEPSLVDFNVPDPIGLPPEDYRYSMNIIREEIKRAMESI